MLPQSSSHHQPLPLRYRATRVDQRADIITQMERFCIPANGFLSYARLRASSEVSTARLEVVRPVPEPTVVVTQLLLTTPGIEIDAQNSIGQTPLHVACARGNWSVVRLLLEAGASSIVKDRRGLTPGQVALKRGMPIPIDLLPSLGDPVAIYQ